MADLLGHSSASPRNPEERRMPVLPLRDIVVFPHMIVPLFVGRERSVAALNAVMQSGRKIMLLAQRDAGVEDPSGDDLYATGTLANVLQLLKLPDDTIKVLVEGAARARVHRVRDDDDFLVAEYSLIEDASEDVADVEAAARNVRQTFESYVKLNTKVPPEVLVSVSGVSEAGRLADTVASHLNLKMAEKQALLESVSLVARLEMLCEHMEAEMNILQVDKRIRNRVKRQMEKSQRDYYLSEQMKAIQKELGEDEQSEIEALEKRIDSVGLTAEAKEKARREIKRLKMMPAMSAEATVVHNYLDWLTSVPWKKRSRLNKDFRAAQAVLEADHYGLEKVKERILEHLAVLQLVRRMKGPILCLVGPPGVGKTSLGRSIARAVGRKFVRMSLGGLRDEAEIRGHRRTYIGAMPGKVIQSMKKAGTRNPLILLDEIDKLGADFRGDPSSALLEVLDPEQNHAFNDHYLEVDYDLSEVMFITTANSLNIPGPLRDRMEIIRISGYTEAEKLAIARRYLLPSQVREHGLKKDSIRISDDVLLDVIRHHTQEAGVRDLNRMLARLCRKVAKRLVEDRRRKRVAIALDDLEDYLGVPPYRHDMAEEADQVGVVTGLAWTEVGGELLKIEAALMPGKGELTVTGQIGSVMQESVRAAFTYVRSRATSLGLKADFHRHVDVHVHVPEGAIPKDGPSAGLAMATTMVSVLTGIAVRRDICMTGEINLRGKALPIGGLKEKLLAAQRGGLKTVLIPKGNRKDLREVPASILDGLQVMDVADMDEVLRHALVRLPEGMSDMRQPDPALDIYLSPRSLASSAAAMHG